MKRKEAEKLASEAGASIEKSLSNRIDYLIVGIQNRNIVGTDGLSSKMKKAKKLAANGHKIEMIDEGEFYIALGMDETINATWGQRKTNSVSDSVDEFRASLLAYG